MAATIPAASTEYLHGLITASVTLDTQVVEVAFITPSNGFPSDATAWITAAWTGTAGTSRNWQLLVGPSSTTILAAGTYAVWTRVHDNPEIPVRKHDTLTIQ